MSYCESIRLRLSDGYEAFARLWRPEQPRGAILYLHGIQSHGRWFEVSARRLADAGFMVLLPDRRGSGRNDIDRGHADSAYLLLRDATEALDELHTRTGFDRLHVIGVSWGGKVAAALYGHAPTRISSLTLVAPGLFPKVDLPLGTKLRVGWSALVRRKRLFDIPLNDPRLFTANVEYQAFLRNDPLALHQVTASFLLASRKMDKLARHMTRHSSATPLHLFLAGHDQIIDNDRTRRFVTGLGWPNTKITEYPSAEHTLEFETDPEPYFQNLRDWIVQSNSAF
ncbi:MAG: alpha/beta hydrolase [Phycisphaerales bacterium]|nr:alpha/beta hydrolase [Phycisphaerales bacterium]